MTSHVALKPGRGRGRGAARLAWWSLALFPVSFVGAFLVGEGLMSLTGHGSGEGPVWAVAVSGIPALLVAVAPTGVTIHFARLALRLGRGEALAPVVIALTVAGGFVLLNLLAYVVGSILGS